MFRPQDNWTRNNNDNKKTTAKEELLARVPTVVFDNYHLEVVRSILQLRDGTILSCSDDFTIYRWTKSGILLSCFIGHSDWVWGLIELNDTIIASASHDKTIRVWNLDTNECIKLIHTGSQVRCLLKSRDNQVFMSGMRNGVIDTWRISDFVQVNSYQSSGCVDSLCELEEDLVNAEQDLEVWKSDNRTILIGHKNAISRVVQLRDKSIVSANLDHSITIWNGKTGERVRTLVGHTNYVNEILELVDGTLVSASDDRTLKLWNIDGECILTRKTTYQIYRIAELDDGSIITGGRWGEMEIWNTQNRIGKKKLLQVTSSNSLVNCCCRPIAKSMDCYDDILKLPLPSELIDICEAYYQLNQIVIASR